MVSLAEKIQSAKQMIEQTEKISVLTGAGISAESGVPTFRDSDGYWHGRSPMELASMAGFLKDPALVWEWYHSRRRGLKACQPNPGHFALAELEASKAHCKLVTQNVDRLHQAAGSQNIIEIHGNIWENACIKCDYRAEALDENMRCPTCFALLRPTVVWFGEALAPGAWEKASAWVEKADILLVVGTSAVVYPAAQLIPIAKAGGAIIIEVNTQKTAASDLAAMSLLGKSATILPQLVTSSPID